MQTVTYFRAMAHNNAWANHRMLTACEALSDAELNAERVGFFPSILHTLNHILTVDWYYVDALEGGRLGPGAWEKEIPCPSAAALGTEQSAVDRRLIAYCEGLTEPALGGRVTMNRGRHDQVDSVDRVLLHLFQHQIHHRGQAHAMLSGTSVRPPQLDEFFMSDEASLREQEFAELGFSESDIWSDSTER